MGVSTNTYVVAGVRVSDVLTIDRREKTERKFDPDTGKPYDLVSPVFVPVLFGRDQPGLEPNPEDWTGAEIGSLKVFDTGIDAAEDYTARRGLTNPYAGYAYAKHFLGVLVNRGPDPRRPDETPQVAELTFAGFTAAVQAAHAELRRLGYTSEPKVYVVKYLSC